jgi:ceramide glucosyltransferase
LISALLLLISGAGCLYLLYGTAVTGSLKKGAPAANALEAEAPSVTILKPLYGDEPRLFENLASFCGQDHPAPVQIVCGVQNPCDEAIPAVARLKASFPNCDVQLVIDATPHGANRKVANLINMMRHARYDCLIVADSDIAVEPDYLRRVTAALAAPDVGAVTCLYHGVAAAGFWSQMSALAIDAHFLPNVVVGLATGLAKPCFGSTIALTRQRLLEIGGFDVFANRLADDYAMGDVLRARGLRVATSDMLVAHSCAETSFGGLWGHEMRWARTILNIDPLGYVGSLVTHPFGWALLAAATGAPFAGALAAVAIACRMALLNATARSHRLPRPAYWLLPARDLLSFAVFFWSFCGRDLTWRGRNYHIRADGAMTTD